MTATRAQRILLLLAITAAGAALLVAAVRAGGSPRTMDDRVHVVASTLRCPVCLNLSAADSPSPVAQEMRAAIRRELEDGKTPEQIRSEFVASYGEWILLSPAPRGLNLLAWVAPVAILLAGLVAAVLAIQRWTAGRGSAAKPISGRGARSGGRLTDKDRQLLQEALSGVGEERE